MVERTESGGVMNMNPSEGSATMNTLLRMLEESQNKLEVQLRDNTELRLRLQELEMIDRAVVADGSQQPQDALLNCG